MKSVKIYRDKIYRVKIYSISDSVYGFVENSVMVSVKNSVRNSVFRIYYEAGKL